ncbi:MAG: hypothetical protein IJW38_05685 [Clostridia bacterium]|nr:hypothetical protein [Clostridia bacterium]
MSNHRETTNRDIENINGEDFFEGLDNRELFKRAISEALDLKIREIVEETKDIEIPPPSKRHKIRMNRLFRERDGGDFIPFPDVDNT